MSNKIVIVYFYIGFNKVGLILLKYFLFNNRDILLFYGYLYLRIGIIWSKGRNYISLVYIYVVLDKF